jgi:hypothetical protein
MIFGTDQVEAPPERLSAGPLSADLSDGALRSITWHGIEVLRGINCPIRDVNWGTYLPESVVETLGEEDGGFRYERRFTVADGALACRLVYVGRADGTLTAEVELRPEREFPTNRSGFTVLHPLKGFVGTDMRVEHSSGEERIPAPELISPSQPVFDIVGLHYAVDGANVSLRFSDEIFEMEDQRNWTDASFKTYCRPLSRPWPYTLPAGEPVRQGITLKLSGTPRESGRASGQEAPTLRILDAACPVVALAVEDGWLPGASERRLVATLGVKAFQVRVQRGQTDALREALALVKEFGRSYDLELVVSDDADDARRELAAVAATCAEAGIPPTGVTALPEAYLKSYQPDAAWPTGLSPREAIEAARTAFPGVPVGGGALTNFTELNRCRPDRGSIDFITHGTTAIVHAADDRSVIETLEALPQAFASAEAIGGAVPLRLGLVSIGMRSNPYGAAVADNPELIRKPMAKYDPRQQGLFAAAWAVGALTATEGRRVTSIALAAPAGPFGLSAGPDVAPLYHVVRAAAAIAGQPRVTVAGLPDRVFAVGCRANGRTRLLIANLSAGAETLPMGDGAETRTLDTTSFAAASADPRWLDNAPVSHGDVVVEPFSVAFVELPAGAA